MRFYAAAVVVWLMACVPAPLLAQPAPIAAASCERLAALTLPNTMITLAQVMAPGAFTPPLDVATCGSTDDAANFVCK